MIDDSILGHLPVDRYIRRNYMHFLHMKSAEIAGEVIACMLQIAMAEL
jgi:hypothetical protein